METETGRGKHSSGPWWLPLVIPALFLTAAAIGVAREHRHVANPPGVFGAFAATIVIGAAIGLPAFLAGKRHQRWLNEPVADTPTGRRHARGPNG